MFSKLKLDISFKMSVLRPSETSWGVRYDLFCVSMIIGALVVSDRDHDHDHDHDHDGGHDDHDDEHNDA